MTTMRIDGRSRKRLEREALVAELALIPPELPDGVGGWFNDPVTDVIRPKRPYIITGKKVREAWAKAETHRWHRVPRTLALDFWVELRRLSSPSFQTLKDAVFVRDHAACIKCGRTGGLEVDHIWERYVGGADCMENLELLCYICHRVIKPPTGWSNRPYAYFTALP